MDLNIAQEPASRQVLLKEVADLIDIGAALHWLQPREKRPIAEGWTTAPRATRDDLERQHIAGANIGVRLGEPSATAAGYLHLIDLDIRRPEAKAEAWTELRRLVPTVDQMPMVQSGSGEGRHFYCFSDKPLRSEKLAKGDGWEIELFGTGKQAVLPPSIHPVTGQPYRWVRPLVPELIDLGVGPKAIFQRATTETAETDSEDDWDWWKPDPDWTRIRKALGKVKDASDRDVWLRIGMALKDVSSGSEEHAAEGFRLWCAWSRRCPEKYSEKAQRRTWNSFRRTGTGIGTLFQIAKEWGWTGETETQPAKPSRLAFLTPAECEAAPSRRYVIKGLLAQGDVGCIFGAPGAGKSLLAPFLTYAVAQGREVWGKRVRAGGAFYLAAEDPHGMRGRVRALKAAYGDATGFRLVEGVSNLAPDSPDLVALIEAVETQKPALVVIDTLAMAFPGIEENEAKSMGLVMDAARTIAKSGAAVLLVHHDTKAEGGTPRGHGIFNGALDVALHVKRDGESGIVRAKLTKNRTGPCDLDMAFTIATEDGGIDEDGDVITLPRCRELASDPMQVKLTERQSAALGILKAIRTDDPSGLIPESVWRDACIAEGALTDSPNKESRGATFRTTRKELAELGAIIRLVPEGKTELHVRLAGFSGADAFDDLPERGECSANGAECSVKSQPGQWLGEAESTDTLSPFRGRVRYSPLPDPKTGGDPLAELIG